MLFISFHLYLQNLYFVGEKNHSSEKRSTDSVALLHVLSKGVSSGRARASFVLFSAMSESGPLRCSINICRMHVRMNE